MSLSKIEKLTPEQEALIPVYREKWRQIALSTERLDRAKAESVIKAAYIAIGKPEPEFQFYSSPCVVRKSLSYYWQHYLGNKLRMIARLPLKEIPNNHLENYELGKRLFNQIMVRPLENSLGNQLEKYLVEDLKKQLANHVGTLLKLQLKLVPEQLINIKLRQLQVPRADYRPYQFGERLVFEQLWQQQVPEWDNSIYSQFGGLSFHAVMTGTNSLILPNRVCGLIRPEVWACDASLLDFCFSVLNCPYDQEKWELLQAIIINCGWIYPFEKTCIVCERPIKLSFDSQDRLHAEGKPAIQFADGWGLYSYHGVTLLGLTH